ncbi:MAG TPA: PAS domain S-box protein [Thermoanaerobaculia bacterium]
MRRAGFAALMIAFGAAAALLFFAFYRDAKNAAVASLHEEQRIHAEQAARGIEDFFATWTSSLTALSRMPEILEGTAAGRQQIRLFFEAHREQIRSITRVDAHGVILVACPTIESEGVDISNQKHVGEILRDHRPVVSDVFRAVQGFDAIALHVPVFEGAAFKGSIAVVVNFESLAKRYLDVIRIGESGQAWVVSRDGTLLYTPIPGFTGKPASKSFEAFPSVIAMLAEMLQGREGDATYTSNWIRDRTATPARFYAVYAPIRLGSNFWSIVVSSSEKELLAGLRTFRNRLGLVVGLVYLGGMVLSFVALKAWVIVREEARRRQAEEAVRSSERLRALMTSAVSDVLFYLGVEPDGGYRFLSVNTAFLKATGLKESDVVGRTVADVIPEPARAIVLEKYAAAVATRRTITWDETSVYPAGTKYGEVSITPIFDDGGNCTNLFGIVHDVTERKRSEKALKDSEERFRLLVDGVKDYAIVMLDPQGRIVIWNEGARRLKGFEESEILGQPVERFYTAEDVAAGRPAEILRKAEVEGHCEDQGWRVRKDGTRFEAHVSLRALRQPTGELIGFSKITRDVTERMRAERAALRHSVFSEALLESLPGFFCLFDQTGKFLRWNQRLEAVSGYSAEEITAMRPPDLFVEEDRALIEERMAGVFEKGSLDVEATLLSKAGTQTPHYLTGVRFVLDGVTDCIGMGFDVTARKHLEAQLRQSQKLEAIGQLAGGVAHDFNNLLTVIGGHSDLILANSGLEGDLREGVDEIRHAAERAAALTQQLLAFSRKQVLKPKVLDVNDAVGQVEKMLRRLIGEHVIFETRLQEDLGHVKADPSQIEQVIMNLAVNARDAMPEGGTLTIESANVELEEALVGAHVPVRPGPHVMLAVTDTGVGMDHETQRRLFEPFFTTKEQGKGTGLGLATTYGIVKQSGGFIRVSSELGKGTTFRIYLPRVEERAEPAVKRKSGADLMKGSAVVLLVEDEEPVRRLARIALERRGYSVLEASTGADAIVVAAGHPGKIDLLLTDIVMPGIGGMELAHRIRENRPDVRVLVMSGYIRETYGRDTPLDSGFAFLEKPFSPQTLIQMVGEVLEKK